MISIISGTNRPGNLSRILAAEYKREFEERGEEVRLIDLQKLPANIAFGELYGKRSPHFEEFQQALEASHKLMFVVPEYNGSIPGILKLFIDALNYPDTWKAKKAAITGLSAGQGGNEVGTSHLEDIMNYLGVPVLPRKVIIPKIREKMNREGLMDVPEWVDLRRQIEEFIEF